MPGIYLIVEGHGEERAAPRLVANILKQHLQKNDFFFWPAFRVSRGGIATINDEMRTALASARVTIDRANGQGFLLILVDSDDDCAVTLAQTIQTGILGQRFPHPFSVVACVREYEAWFLAAASSLRGSPNVRSDAEDIPHAEQIRDAKGAIEKRILRPGKYYSPSVDQPEFSAALSPQAALKCRSFRKLVKELGNAVAT